MKFSEIGLLSKTVEILEKNGYSILTPIQEKIIPAIMEGHDVLGCSKTGSGKTGAFLIPIIEKLNNNPNKKAAVVVPTRELAMQIMDNAKKFSENGSMIAKALLIGGASIKEQLLAIQKKPRLIIGTPGRINDFLDSKRLDMSDFETLVLDEMDRMLDMGFSCQVDEIVKRIAANRQTLLFSATVSKNIEKMSQKYLKNPIVVKIGETNLPSENVSQEIIEVENDKKFDVLMQKLKANTLFTLIFVKTRHAAERLAKKLDKNNVLAKAIHGDVKQNKRAKIIKDFRDKKFNVLVATDIAARGLDIHHIDTVINYDLPQSPEDYIHRIGRCSRGIDAKGCSISFCNESDKKLLNAIKSMISSGDYDAVPIKKNKKVKSKNTNNFHSKKARSNSNKLNMTENNKNEKNKSEKNIDGKRHSGYNFDGLISKKNKSSNTKRPSTYSVSKTNTLERRKRLGLIN